MITWNNFIRATLGEHDDANTITQAIEHIFGDGVVRTPTRVSWSGLTKEVRDSDAAELSRQLYANGAYGGFVTFAAFHILVPRIGYNIHHADATAWLHIPRDMSWVLDDVEAARRQRAASRRLLENAQSWLDGYLNRYLADTELHHSPRDSRRTSSHDELIVRIAHENDIADLTRTLKDELGDPTATQDSGEFLWSNHSKKPLTEDDVDRILAKFADAKTNRARNGYVEFEYRNGEQTLYGGFNRFEFTTIRVPLGFSYEIEALGTDHNRGAKKAVAEKARVELENHLKNSLNEDTVALRMRGSEGDRLVGDFITARVARPYDAEARSLARRSIQQSLRLVGYGS